MILKHTISCLVAVMSLTLVQAQSTDSDHIANHETVKQCVEQKTYTHKEIKTVVEDDQFENLSTSDSIVTIINAFKVFPNSHKNKTILKTNAIEPKINLL